MLSVPSPTSERAETPLSEPPSIFAAMEVHGLPPAFTPSFPGHRVALCPDVTWKLPDPISIATMAARRVLTALLRVDRPDDGIYQTKDCGDVAEVRLAKHRFLVTIPGRLWIDVVASGEPEEQGMGSSTGDRRTEAERRFGTEEPPALGPLLDPIIGTVSEAENRPPTFPFAFRGASDPSFPDMLTALSTLFKSAHGHRLLISDVVLSDASLKRELDLVYNPNPLERHERRLACDAIRSHLVPGNKAELLKKLFAREMPKMGDKLTIVIEDGVLEIGQVEVKVKDGEQQEAIWLARLFSEADQAVEGVFAE